MTIDPDILAIRRKRKREGRCLQCGKMPARYKGRPTVLCLVCAATLAYCANCEALYPRPRGLATRRTSRYCDPCKAAYARASGRHTPYAKYLADRQARRHRLLPTLIKLYKQGASLRSIGAAVGLTRNQAERMIHDARLRGEWPTELKRKAHGR